MANQAMKQCPEANPTGIKSTINKGMYQCRSVWIVSMEYKGDLYAQPFEHWTVALAFAVYIFRHPQVMR